MHSVQNGRWQNHDRQSAAATLLAQALTALDVVPELSQPLIDLCRHQHLQTHGDPSRASHPEFGQERIGVATIVRVAAEIGEFDANITYVGTDNNKNAAMIHHQRGRSRPSGHV